MGSVVPSITIPRAKYNVFDIVKWFLWRSHMDEEEREAESITLLKLMKLLYYAEGCAITFINSSLFPDKIEAWEHGPAIRCVWNEYHKCARNLPYDDSYKKAVWSIDVQDRDILEDVWGTFGIYTAWGLREKTHQEDPWINASKNGTCFKNTEITREAIYVYFADNFVRG